MKNKMIKCKTCGGEIAKSAKVCPKCGAKQKKSPILGIVVTIIAIIIIAGALGGDSDSGPKKIGSASSDKSNSSISKTEQQTVFAVGETVSLNDIVVTLVDVSESDGKNYMKPEDGNTFILCEFEIENQSNNDIAVSSIMSFEAYVDDYSTNMSLTAVTSSDKSQLDGSVAAGKKMNGVIGYEASKDWENIEIRFTPSFWSGKDITFVYSK